MIESGSQASGLFFFLSFSLAFSLPGPGLPFPSCSTLSGPSPAAGGSQTVAFICECVRRSLGTERQETFPAGRNQLQPNQTHLGASQRQACQHGDGLKSTERLVEAGLR